MADVIVNIGPKSCKGLDAFHMAYSPKRRRKGLCYKFPKQQSVFLCVCLNVSPTYPAIKSHIFYSEWRIISNWHRSKNLFQSPLLQLRCWTSTPHHEEENKVLALVHKNQRRVSRRAGSNQPHLQLWLAWHLQPFPFASCLCA